MPRFRFVVISSPFVAIGATYCHKLHLCCNMAVLLRQLRRVAGNHHFVAIESGYCNRVELCGDIRNHIATILACGGSYGYCCNKWIPIATKYVHVVIGRILPHVYCVAINITYCDKICIRGNMDTILQQSPSVAKRRKILQQYSQNATCFVFFILYTFFHILYRCYSLSFLCIRFLTVYNSVLRNTKKSTKAGFEPWPRWKMRRSHTTTLGSNW